MKKIILTFLAVLISLNLFSQGTYFRQISYNDALIAAKKENKAIFVDIYTSWCGPCKSLAENIFPQKEVGDVFNANFICVKFDAEKTDDGKAIAKTFKVTAYPTLLFLNGDGELVYKFLGGRDVPGILKEAESAIKAYTNFPKLKELETEYNRGNRSKKFLDDYFLALNDSGLDCGNVLIDYFKLLSDDEIVQADIIKRIEKVTVFNEDLANRLINIDIDKWKSGTMDKKDFSALNSSIGKFLGNCLSAAGAQNDPDDFEKVLELKQKFFTIDSNRNSILMASMGGGNIYVPSEINAMDYYLKRNLNDKFIAVYEKFMNMLKNDYDKNRESREQMAKAMAEKLNEAIKAGDSETIKSINKNAGLFNMMQGLDAHYNVVALLTNTEKYIALYKGVKDEKFYKNIVDNSVFLNEYYPSCKNAPLIAENLIGTGNKDAARQVLVLALDQGAKAVEVNEEWIDKCKKLLEEVK